MSCLFLCIFVCSVFSVLLTQYVFIIKSYIFENINLSVNISDFFIEILVYITQRRVPLDMILKALGRLNFKIALNNLVENYLII